jgi:hypothetical protein
MYMRNLPSPMFYFMIELYGLFMFFVFVYLFSRLPQNIIEAGLELIHSTVLKVS